jgi:phospholipid/cholesterol/gamma-HCH transport system substrate-binding protein
MAEPSDTSGKSEPAAARIADVASGLMPRNLGVKVGILIAFTVMVIGSFIIYVLYARGVFEQTQRLYLITDNAEGVGLGTDLTFAGFPIGRVRRITLRDDGKARISVRPGGRRQGTAAPIERIRNRRALVGALLRAYTPTFRRALPDRASGRCCAATRPRRSRWSRRCAASRRIWSR